MILSCIDFPEAPRCCGSCHDDEEEGYCQLGEKYAEWSLGDPEDKRFAMVCCTVMQAVNWKDPETWEKANVVREARESANACDEDGDTEGGGAGPQLDVQRPAGFGEDAGDEGRGSESP